MESAASVSMKYRTLLKSNPKKKVSYYMLMCLFAFFGTLIVPTFGYPILDLVCAYGIKGYFFLCGLNILVFAYKAIQLSHCRRLLRQYPPHQLTLLGIANTDIFPDASNDAPPTTSQTPKIKTPLSHVPKLTPSSRALNTTVSESSFSSRQGVFDPPRPDSASSTSFSQVSTPTRRPQFFSSPPEKPLAVSDPRVVSADEVWNRVGRGITPVEVNQCIMEVQKWLCTEILSPFLAEINSINHILKDLAGPGAIAPQFGKTAWQQLQSLQLAPELQSRIQRAIPYISLTDNQVTLFRYLEDLERGNSRPLSEPNFPSSNEVIFNLFCCYLNMTSYNGMSSKFEKNHFLGETDLIQYPAAIARAKYRSHDFYIFYPFARPISYQILFFRDYDELILCLPKGPLNVMHVILCVFFFASTRPNRGIDADDRNGLSAINATHILPSRIYSHNSK